MSRVKTFDATGIAPGGVLFAGDLNSIQDHYADASNFAQTVDVATVRFGDSAIQMVKFGTGEARITAALRTDGIIRGLGGLYSGQFTTAGRPGAGFRPYGILIFNTDTSRYEINVGSDASPTWITLLATPDVTTTQLGAMFDYTGSADISSSLVLADGREISRATFAAYFALVGTTYGTGNGTTTFNIPDCRGRAIVGPDNMGTAQGAANRIPNSNRALGQSGGVELQALTTAQLPSHSHGGTTGGNSVDHTHGMNHDHAIQVQSGSAGASGVFGAGSGSISDVGGGGAGGPVKFFFGNTAGASTSHTHAIPAEGSGTGHNTMQPYQVINKIVRIA